VQAVDANHQHDYKCMPSDERMLACDCGMVTRINDLLNRTAVTAQYHTLERMLTKHMLTPAARKIVNKELQGHSLNREVELAKPRQMRLLPWKTGLQT